MKRAMGKYRLWGVYLLLAGLSFAVYKPVLHHQFIGFDDDIYITENPHIQSGVNPGSVLWAFSFTGLVYWMPLAWLSHILDCQLFGLNAGMHHLTNLLIHIANTLLLFTVFKRITGALWKSAFVAALFALHPVNVDSVAWIAERKNVLSTFFWMLTMLAYVYYTEKPSASRYFLMLAAFVFGLLAKPMLITLPFVLLLLDYWPLKRLQNKKDIYHLVVEKVPFFVLSAVSMYLYSVSYEDPDAQVVPMGLRTANALVSYIKYILKLIWPTDLAIFYPYPSSVPLWQVIGSVLLLIGISAIIILLIKKKPYLLVGWLWYTGTLVPVLGLVQTGLWPAMADRWAYIPLIGIFIMLAWGADELLSGRRWRKIALGISAAAVLFALSICTSFQLRYWQNSITLFGHALKVTTNNFVAYNNLGVAYGQLGRYQDETEAYEQAVKIKPDFADARCNLGVAYGDLGRYQQAVENCKQAIKIKPDVAKTHYNLGVAYGNLGWHQEAIEAFEDAIRIKPDYADAYDNIGVAYSKLGNSEKAIGAFKRAVKIEPDFVDAHYNLGVAYSRPGSFDKAIEAFKQVIKIKPDFVDAHYNLGVAYNKLGSFEKAIEAFKQAVKIKPDYAEAHNNLGIAYSKLGSSEKAIEAFKQAVGIKPDLAEAHYNLGRAYLANGNSGSALEECKILKNLDGDAANELSNLINK